MRLRRRPEYSLALLIMLSIFRAISSALSFVYIIVPGVHPNTFETSPTSELITARSVSIASLIIWGDPSLCEVIKSIEPLLSAWAIPSRVNPSRFKNEKSLPSIL